MNLKKIKINNNIYRLYFKKGVFEPTATTNFLISSFIKRNKKISNKKILDLGCGSGIVSIIINDKLENNIFYASDLSKNSIVCCDKNFKKFKIKGIIKNGSLFKPWTDKKFDYIINDISGISSILSKKSNWFKNVPADTGEDGTKLTIQVIKDSKKRLTKNGKLYLPLISLCNNDKVIKIAKLFFKNIKITSENRWFLPKELEKNKKLLEKLKKQNKISFEYKFGKFICSTRILELKN